MGDTDDDERSKKKRKMNEENPQTYSDDKSSPKALKITRVSSSSPKSVKAVIKEYKCPECGLSFSSPRALGPHKRAHLPPRADITFNADDGYGNQTMMHVQDTTYTPQELAQSQTLSLDETTANRNVKSDSSTQSTKESKEKLDLSLGL